MPTRDLDIQEILDTYSDTERSFTPQQKRQILEAAVEQQSLSARLMVCAVAALLADDAPKLGGELAGLLTPQETAEQLGVQVRTIYRLRKEGALPAVHVGRWVRFDPEDVQQYRRLRKKRELTGCELKGSGASDDQNQRGQDR